MKSELVKRLIVDSENLSFYHKKFFNDEELSEDEISHIVSTTPFHPLINWGEKYRLTLLPWTALENIHEVIKKTIENNIEGDFVETGVWKGGACILAKSIYNELDTNRKVYCADSFEGLPKPSPEYHQDTNDTHYLDPMLSVSLDDVKNNFKKFKLLDDNVIFVKGWFKDTMPNFPVDKISILRLDGDMYESTIQVLESLYDKLSVGGYCIVDDYYHMGCKMAIEDFRSKRNITSPIIKIDDNPNNEVHYWVKYKI
jgi:O-methyltransferase